MNDYCLCDDIYRLIVAANKMNADVESFWSGHEELNFDIRTYRQLVIFYLVFSLAQLYFYTEMF